MKSFVSGDYKERIVSVFASGDPKKFHIIPFQEFGSAQALSVEKTVETLLDSITVMKLVVYTPKPTLEDIKHLDLARNAFCAIYELQGWKIHVGPHFFLNHSFEHFLQDLTFYEFLLEGTEHHNRLMHELAKNVFTGTRDQKVSSSRNTLLYQRMKLKQLLQDLFTQYYPDHPSTQKGQDSPHLPVPCPRNLVAKMNSPWFDEIEKFFPLASEV
jgi:hypothetical protein